MLRGRQACLVVVVAVVAAILAACGRGGTSAAARSPVASIYLGAYPATMPAAIGLNPVTNRIYVADTNAREVTVIDGATKETTARVGLGVRAGILQKVAVNPASNRIYVVEGSQFGGVGGPGPFVPVIRESGDVAVIDGTSNATAVVHVGGTVQAVAVDPSNGKAYVTSSSRTGTVIDGTSNATATVAVGQVWGAPAVNPVTNKIYVGTDAGVVAIDGATNATATVHAAAGATLAVDPAANRIYASGGGGLTVIDATTNGTIADIPLGHDGGGSLAVNAKTHKVYVLDVNYPNPGSVTVVDGTTLATTAVAVGRSPTEIVVDESANAAYVLDLDSSDVVRIDGANQATAFSLPGALPLIAVNPATGKLYVAAGGPKAGRVSASTPTNLPPPPMVLDVLDFKGTTIPSVPVDTCQPSPQPGSGVARGTC